MFINELVKQAGGEQTNDKLNFINIHKLYILKFNRCLKLIQK